MYMGSPIRPHEELRAGMLDADDCSSCRAKSTTGCENCSTPLCEKCAITCSVCRTVDHCITCARRNGMEEVNGAWFCENCAPMTDDEFDAEIIGTFKNWGMKEAKLSEAIRLGSMLRPQGFGYFQYRLGTACALDAASLAVGMGEYWVGEEQAQRFRKYKQHDIAECPGDQPCNFRSRIRSTPCVLSMAVHLNDDHLWTRERIADWVATIEAQQEELALPTVPVHEESNEVIA